MCYRVSNWLITIETSCHHDQPVPTVMSLHAGLTACGVLSVVIKLHHYSSELKYHGLAVSVAGLPPSAASMCSASIP